MSYASTALYGHFAKVLCKPGQLLKFGDEIGVLGNTGYSSGAHTHLTVIPQERDIHWFGDQTKALGGTEKMIMDFLNAAPIICNKNGYRTPIISGGWYSYAGHGAVDFYGPDRTSIAGDSIIIWNQTFPGRVLSTPDYGTTRTGKTVLVLFGEKVSQPASGGGGSVEDGHTIVAGDTIWALAEQWKVPYWEVVQYNNITDVYALKIGTKIKNPRAAGQTTNNTDVTHIVQAGDTLSTIAEYWTQKGIPVTVDTLVALNQIKDKNLININQKLIIKRGTVRPLQEGDKVRVTASHYATGEEVPEWVRHPSATYIVSEAGNDAVLLDSPYGINSWVKLSGVYRV